jgi:hypothetical protein
VESTGIARHANSIGIGRIQTEFEVIQSEVVLGKVIRDLEVGEKWRQRNGGGQPLKPQEVLALVKSTGPAPRSRPTLLAFYSRNHNLADPPDFHAPFR